MKTVLQQCIANALATLGILGVDEKIRIEYTRDRQHGDFSCNIALLIAKSLGRKPQDVANDIMAHLSTHPAIKQVNVAGAGFINFSITPNAWKDFLATILQQKNQFGRSTIGEGQRVHIEFVSSNPTGPLHVGHGRGAAYGAAVADLLTAIGYDVHREYYVNDAGRQMDILTTSVWLRYLALCGEVFVFPSNGYQGNYVHDIAKQLYQQPQKTFFHPAAQVFANAPNDEEDKEAHIDALIANAKKLLGETVFQQILNVALHAILDDIREDLAEFGVIYQEWFSEQQLWKKGLADIAIQQLRDRGHLYEKDGAVWFRSTTFGDDKDRVVIRENGAYTYFASDIAYHRLKFDRGFHQVIDVLGADHHGYIPRLRAIIAALGYPVENFHAPIVQFATLYRGKERVAMSTRSGSFVTLRELREEVGKDAARFFYVMRKADQHMDFDLELAKSHSNENPVYYIQYAHARIASVFRQMHEKQLDWDAQQGLNALQVLDTDLEKQLLLCLSRYPETILQAAQQYEPHLLVYYLRELADLFHRYYNATSFLVQETALRHARLTLVSAVRQILANGLQLLDVSAPETM